MKTRFLIVGVITSALFFGAIKAKAADNDMLNCTNCTSVDGSDSLCKKCLESDKQTDPTLQLKLALLLFEKKDYINAEKWLRKSAEQGNIKAQYLLGDALFCGDVFKKDYTESRFWLAKAAKAGNIDAQYTLGLLLYSDEASINDYEGAFNWFDKAAKQNHAGAQNYLGILYELGHGVNKNIEEAYKYYLKSAIQGESDAQYNLSNLCAKKGYLELESLRALKWMLLASKGDENYEKHYNQAIKDVREDFIRIITKAAELFRKQPIDKNDKKYTKWIADYKLSFKTAKTVEELQTFIISYEYDDPDNLVPQIQAKYNKLLANDAIKKLKKDQLEEKKFKAQLTTWRAGLRIGDQTNLGMIIEIKRPIVKIQTFLGERWININQLYPQT